MSNQDWLERSNAQTLYHIERQGRTGPGLVPFLGAGLSTAYKFKNWKNLLLDAAPPGVLPRVRKQLKANNYEGAAETLLQELGADGFQNTVAAFSGDSHLDPFDFRKGTISLLPLLASGPVITTNFDRVLERAFMDNGTPFESVISGPRPDLIVDALHGNRRVLIKLHGDWQDRVGRTFAGSEYKANYGEAQPEQKRLLLAATEKLLFSSRSLLFIGASLGPDRTVRVLAKTHKDYAGIRHFTIMAVPTGEGKFEATEKHLRNLGVLPLWYRAETDDDHAREVQKLVASIVERISVRTIEDPAPEKSPPASRPARRIPSHLPPSTKFNTHFDRVVRLIEDGRLTFVLGTAIHLPTNLMADKFYRRLVRLFECRGLNEERSAISQYIADRYGRDSLYAEINKLLKRTPFKPRATHELFAAWNDFSTYAGNPVPPPLVITTNYDALLEDRLTEAGVRHHLLSYQADGPHRRLFYHRSPENGLRIIERPLNIQSLSDDLVVLKLNGGLGEGIRESYVTTRLDYWDLAGQLPGVLPAVIQQRLAASPLLFLGHGLREPDVESLVRFAHKDRSDPRSWAVAKGKKSGIKYWRQLGVEIIDDVDINDYMNELRRRLSKNGPPLRAV